MRPASWLLVLVLAGCALGRGPSDGLPIGALLPLTGALKSYGESSQAVLIEAAAAINARGGRGVALDVEDTRTDPAGALDALKRLATRGVRLAVGPYASSEVKAVKAFADSHGIILISPLSTASSLAIPDDNVFRLMPDDEQEAAAVAALAIADGVRVMVPVSRDDEGNRGLQAAFKSAFEKRGGKIIDGVTYGPKQASFVGVVRSVLRSLTQAKQAHAGPVGVYLTAFDEVVLLFGEATAARRDTPGAAGTLGGVKWYGSDSVAQSKELLTSPNAAAFALRAGYPNPILGLDDRPRTTWRPISERVTAKLGRAPDPFALVAYDALMVGYQTLLRAGDGADAVVLRHELTAVADTYDGVTGRTTLNAAGDRASGDYDFWAICRVGNALAWGRAAVYTRGEARRISGCDQQAR